MDTKRCIAFGIITVFLLASSAPVLAAELQKAEDGIPSTAVARLKISKGTAWVRSAGSADWEESASNFPLVETSRVSIPQGSEAEIQFRGSQSLLLQGGAEVDIRQLGEREASYRLRSGQAVLSLPKEDFAPVRVTVPGNREVRVDAPGQYVLSADRGSTRFLVRAGEGAVTAEKGPPIAVKAGEEASIGEEIRVRRVGSAAPGMVEEAPLTATEEATGIPPAAAGELRQYGEWVSTPEYGYAWRPYVGEDWEPYYYGRWTWVSPYGWTWVGYEPWGWWPYHTGWWWPSPVFGWVWCPFNSFASVNFFYGGSVYFGHHARFFPGNVRFFGRDRFARWGPARPGEIASRSGSFSRGDSRLARWDRPVERGSVKVRRDGGGRPVAWEGRGGSPRGAVSSRGTEIPRNGLRPGGSSVSRTRDGGAVRARQANYGTVARTGSTRPSVVGGGTAAGRSGRYSDPVRSSVERVPSSRPGGGSPRNFVTGGSRGGMVTGGSRGDIAGGGSPRNFVTDGSRGSMVGSGSRGGIAGGGSRGFGTGSRGPAGGR